MIFLRNCVSGRPVMLVVFFSCWAGVVCAPAICKMLAAVMMLHYAAILNVAILNAAILNALSNVFASLILGNGYLAEIMDSPKFIQGCTKSAKDAA